VGPREPSAMVSWKASHASTFPTYRQDKPWRISATPTVVYESSQRVHANFPEMLMVQTWQLPVPNHPNLTLLIFMYFFAKGWETTTASVIGFPRRPKPQGFSTTRIASRSTSLEMTGCKERRKIINFGAAPFLASFARSGTFLSCRTARHL